ncbi:hypothetical protein PR001_g14016 [Phytophthora rubi]|uniref:Uncharacterized protein n=1 Tax=Phytophthora rubi TaxID=129364 RepID=A0A6A3LSW5_9STRA|nr:hypothetical protein PR001_g14016 [Phytophthora rubi]
MIRDLALDSVLLAKYKPAKVDSFKKIVLSETLWVMEEITLKLFDPIHKCIAHFEKDSLSFGGVVELLQHGVNNDDISGIEKAIQAMFRKKIKTVGNSSWQARCE